METNNGVKKTENKSGSDDEIIENLDVLMNLETLEQSEVWDEVMNLSELGDEVFKNDEKSEKED